MALFCEVTPFQKQKLPLKKGIQILAPFQAQFYALLAANQELLFNSGFWFGPVFGK